MRNSETFEVTTPGDTEIVMTRLFDATPELVFDALTKREYVAKWLLGPDGWSMPVCEIDLRVGGEFRYVWRSDENGTEFGVNGAFREIEAPGRIVHTELFNDDWTNGESVVTDTIAEENGKTRLTMSVAYSSKEVRDMVIETGMSRGVATSFDRLEGIFGESATAA
jgi:uncharacterized protein YndB with AHSA1/START domain